MVQQHAEKLQKAKETTSRAKLRALMPHLGQATLEVALRECQWDADRAAALLRRFAIVHAKELSGIEKERKAIEDAAKGRERGSDDNQDARRGRGGHRSKSSKSRKESKHKKDRKERKSKKSKKDRKKRDRTVGSEYGKHGIIRESDMYAKRPEFMLWASEVKNIDVEVLPKYEEKDLFKEYMEDYNTATLPHAKYYDNELYERQRAAEQRRAGPGEELSALEDEEELRRQRAAQRAQEQSERLRAAYAELHTTDKARDMREQELLRARMGLAYRMGDTAEAQRLAARLAPDDPAHPQR
ncbi:hypothetical protein QBZ16_004537 [Prototheca wickerhamii]|uniref:Uncharacterized protein n=1 Tax=Prototheca wickerhamii TaxID=3111 RepID=A0AAD9IFZ1_PROWI|nr:hypothetical protein QBZ16_004537 [Prototheca wickerhamii]